ARGTVGDGPPSAMKNGCGFIIVVILKHDHGDETLRNGFEILQAAFDIVDEDNGVFKAAGAIRSDLGAKEFAAQQRGQPANFNGSIKITAQQRAGAMAILANFILWSHRGRGGGTHAAPPCRERGGLKAIWE